MAGVFKKLSLYWSIRIGLIEKFSHSYGLAFWLDTKNVGDADKLG